MHTKCLHWLSCLSTNNNNGYFKCLTLSGPKCLHILYVYILSKFNAYNTTHTHMHPHIHAHVHMHAYTHTLTHTQLHIRAMGLKGRFKKKKITHNTCLPCQFCALMEAGRWRWGWWCWHRLEHSVVVVLCRWQTACRVVATRTAGMTHWLTCWPPLLLASCSEWKDY